MKKLNITQNSRTPFWMRDLEFMQESSREVFDAMLKALSLEATDFIISGCVVTTANSKVSMTAGWCYFNGEILPVTELAPTTYTGSNPKIKFTRTTRYNPEGDRTITLSGNTGTSQLYKDDCLTPSLVSGSETYRLAIGQGAWNLGERIANTVKTVDSGTVEATVTMAGIGTVRYRQIGGVVQVFGNIFNDALGGFSGAVASGLPHPAVGLYLPLNPEDGSGSIQIGIDGTLSVSTQANRVHLDHIVYVATPTALTDDKHYSTTQQSQGGTV